MEAKTKKPSQQKLILKALRNGHRLTGLDFVREFQILNYRARISELRSEGNPIASKIITTRSGKRIAQYYIENSA